MQENNIIERMKACAGGFPAHEEPYISNLMYMIWLERDDLRAAFDLATEQGRADFIAWYCGAASREYGIDERFIPAVKAVAHDESGRESQRAIWNQIYLVMHRAEKSLRKVFHILPLGIQESARRVWWRARARLVQRVVHAAQLETPPERIDREENARTGVRKESVRFAAGANLVGYARAELGMGEHVRMVARACQETPLRYCVNNFSQGTRSRQKDHSVDEMIKDVNPYKVNLFHINADQMLRAFSHLGPEFFGGRYNVGYWAWELAKCPDRWVPVFSLVDEIWAPSRFIQDAFAEKAKLPVVHMPLCVTVPDAVCADRERYGLPRDAFLLMYSFDFFSYIDRKNPQACIDAFRLAFPARCEDNVGLVIKVMNGSPSNPAWKQFMAQVAGDKRIKIINETLGKEELVGLKRACDCYVSLHRSEGFGRGPAEAMLLGKPVIVTNYSGNVDFTLSSNSCLVDYRLIPVASGQYPYSEGQVWADPSVEHAAWYMRRLFEDSQYYSAISGAARRHMEDYYSPKVIGEMYYKRTVEICIGAEDLGGVIGLRKWHERM